MKPQPGSAPVERLRSVVAGLVVLVVAPFVVTPPPVPQVAAAAASLGEMWWAAPPATAPGVFGPALVLAALPAAAPALGML